MTERRARFLGNVFALSWLGLLALYIQDVISPHGQIKHRDLFVPLLLAFVAVYSACWL